MRFFLNFDKKSNPYCCYKTGFYTYTYTSDIVGIVSDQRLLLQQKKWFAEPMKII
jgi:hypothetical protein